MEAVQLTEQQEKIRIELQSKKALAYDLIATIENVQVQLKQVNDDIAKLTFELQQR